MKLLSFSCMLVLIAVVPLSGVFAQQPAKSHLIVIEDTQPAATENPVISIGQAVIWNNRTSLTPFQVVIDEYDRDITAHPLTRGFVRNDTFLVTRTLVVPGNVVSYYFAETGTYPYRVLGQGLSYTGTITVKD